MSDIVELGNYSDKKDQIKINLTSMWNDFCTNEDQFIKLFAKQMEHEQIHRAIASCLDRRFQNKYAVGEESVVYLLQSLKMPKYMEDWYLEIYGE